MIHGGFCGIMKDLIESSKISWKTHESPISWSYYDAKNKSIVIQQFYWGFKQ